MERETALIPEENEQAYNTAVPVTVQPRFYQAEETNGNGTPGEQVLLHQGRNRSSSVTWFCAIPLYRFFFTPCVVSRIS